MLVKIHGAAIQGIDAIGVDIELTAVHNPSTVITIVGLPDTAVKESVDRVRSAIRERAYRDYNHQSRPGRRQEGG